MAEASAIEREVEKNFEAFERQVESLIEIHSGKFALMRNCQIVEYFDTAGDAVRGGKARYKDCVFSVQEVTPKALDLAHAYRNRQDTSATTFESLNASRPKLSSAPALLPRQDRSTVRPRQRAPTPTLPNR